ncbi:DoxX family protein [Erwinia mallotivora]|uniref:DoxX family protein n=1 Tax=Erwinia mallotivora TaxID=69222 RepID=UPI0004B1B75F|nr:DoxX family protein [Erwinia mallotivora]
MIHEQINATEKQPHKLMNMLLWGVQLLIFIAFVIFGGMKMLMPVSQLAAMWVWPGQVPVHFLRGMGLIDALGGAGILLPALLKIKPQLSVWAASGCTLLQICAITFHISRGEAAVTPLNFILLALCGFILWGRLRVVPFSR